MPLTRQSISRAPGRFHSLVVAAALALAAVPAAAQFRDSDARQRIDELRTQVDSLGRTVEGRLAGIDQQLQDKRAIVDLANSIESVRAELARMRGQIEVLQNQIEQSDRRQRDLYNDVDGRMRKMEQARADERKIAEEEAARRKAEEQKVQDVAASETRVYESALNQFKLGNYQTAITQFQSFMTQFPQSRFLPSAQYWVGNSYYALRDYKSAISAQNRVVASWPEDGKAPDALLNIASSQAELGDANAARATLRQLVDKYPKSPAADQAKQRLARRP